MTDPNGVVTTFTYDARNRLLTRTVQAGSGNAMTTFSYDAAGNLIKITLPDSSYLAYIYDTAHRVTKVTDNLGDQITYTLNANGDITQQQVLNSANTISKTQSAVFDSLGRMLKQIGAVSQTTNFAYDGNSNILSIKNPLGDSATRSFDALNRLVKSIDPLSKSTTYARDLQDNLTSVADPRNLTTSYVYDGFGQVISQTSPDSGATTYTLDKAGNRTNETDARGVVTNRTFDKLNRVLTETYPASTGENIAYTYDSTTSGNKGIGRLTGFTDESGSTALTWNERGDVLTDKRVINGITYTTSYSYNLADHVLTITYPSGHIITYTRDVLGRIISASYKPSVSGTATTLASSITYKPFSNLYSTLTYGNGLISNLTYDLDWRLTNMVASGVQSLTLAYNGVDNITSINDGLDATRNQAFTYDKDYRLTNATGKYGTLAYTYDADGNRLSQLDGGVTKTYTYTTGTNHLASMKQGSTTVRTFTYTPNGNIATDSGDANFTYSNRNRNKQAVAGSTTGTYKYNTLGQRVLRTVGTTITSYQYDKKGHLIAESNGATGAVTREYVYLDTMPLAQIESNGTIYYIHPDQTGTPQKMTDSAKAIVWDRVQKPFGETVSTTGTATGNLRFPGQFVDGVSQTNSNGFRDYDFTLGRYPEYDLIGLRGGINPYGYAKGNPLRWIDPNGQSPGAELFFGTLVVMTYFTTQMYQDLHPDYIPQTLEPPLPPLPPNANSCSAGDSPADPNQQYLDQGHLPPEGSTERPEPDIDNYEKYEPNFAPRMLPLR